MKKNSWIITIAVCLMACHHQMEHTAETKHLPLRSEVQQMLDSLTRNADTSYTKPYKRPDFVTAAYYLIQQDSTVCQVMKDSAEQIRQILVSKRNTRIFFEQYYANGQPVAVFKLDQYGQYNDSAVYYNSNGTRQSDGLYKSGFRLGRWKNYNENGQLVSTDEYDSNGQRIITMAK